MKIDGIEGLRVSIRVGGSDLQEYDDATDHLDEPSNAVKYVEASSGSIFKVHTRIKRSGSRRLQSPSKADSLHYTVILDGRRITSVISRVNDQKDDYSQNIDGVTENHDGQFLRRPFQFADLTTNDGTSKGFDVQRMKGLGEIRFEVRWCRAGKRVPAADRSISEVRNTGQEAIPEKCLKGRAISSQAVPCTGSSRAEATYPYGSQPFATYVFRFRSHRDLQIEGIIPRSPSPQPGIPLEERDPAALSAEEARELIRILRERHGERIQVKDETSPEIKYEGVKRARSQMTGLEDDDDLMVTGEGPSSKRARGATDEVVDCIDLTNT
ncbi:hypothetical protein D0866_06780 [Hortaea werneckii]|uniref:DUF7918 domain-containing protein n=1 Tax=Hortaea werneckii TaxID=91943 RepID=A0A3M7AXA4_HORWE|nr:hypothetical protein D0866_06780 [Hortaea werneckii]